MARRVVETVLAQLRANLRQSPARLTQRPISALESQNAMRLIYQGEQRVEVDRLEKVVVNTRLPGASEGLIVSVSAQGNQDRVPAALLLPEPRRQFIAIHPGEPDVQEDHLRSVLAGGDEGLLAAVGYPRIVARHPQEFGHPARRVHSVLDDEHPEPSNRRYRGPSRRDGRGGGRSSSGGEPDDELAPRAGPTARRRHGAAVQLGERPDERQPDAEPPFRTGEGAVLLGKEVEHPREQLGSDADPVVPHAKDDLVPLDSRDELDTSPRRRVFGGIAQEIDENLLDPPRVGIEPQVAGREREQDFVPPLLDDRPHGLDGVVEDGGRVDASLVEVN